MAEKTPKEIWLFRIIHINNLNHILQHGFHTAHSKLANPNYTSIGDNEIIEVRKEYTVDVNPPNGKLGEYIPFYFGYRSPMLYNIVHGYMNVRKYPQSDMVYLCCKLDEIVASQDLAWYFTDGHAKTQTSKPYNDLRSLDKIDWSVVYSPTWNNTEDDFDRKRRKQAEFLVKNHLSVNYIRHIVVYDKKWIKAIKKAIDLLSLDIDVRINLEQTKSNFYY